MARFNRMESLNRMKNIGMIPVFYEGDFETAKGIIKACAEAGATVIEFTNRGDFASEVFARLEQYAANEIPELILGVGSIVDPYTAAIYVDKGASFVVGPILNPDVAKFCNMRKIPYSPGCGSATEINLAHELGCEIVKVFPAGEVGGPGFVKSICGPMPWTSIMPTGGVLPTKESLTAWFNAGVTCVGMGSNLITKEAVGKKDFNSIKNSVQECLQLIKEIRKTGK